MAEEWVRDVVLSAIGLHQELTERYLHDPMYRAHAETTIRTMEIVTEALGDLGLDQHTLPVVRQAINKGFQNDLAAIEYHRAAEDAMALDRKQSYARRIDQLRRERA